MTRDDAERLAKRIINTWHGGPRLEEWIDSLIDLDAGTAGTAFIRCRNELEHAPSIAKFRAEYRALHTVHNDPTRSPFDPPDCLRCDDTGWITKDVVILNDPTSYSSVTPCICDARHQAQRVRERIAKTNAWRHT